MMSVNHVSSVFNMAALPPCSVCNQRASGYHYGANTCEACKGFFRRCLLRKVPHACTHRDCSISNLTPGRKHPCSSCRFKRCIDAGMSIDAIKTGRYTLEKRTKDIEELKKLELQNRIKKDGGLVSCPEDRSMELDRIIQKITDTHLSSVRHSAEMCANIYHGEIEYIEKRALERQMFGSRKPLPRAESRLIRELTGIDVDGRDKLITGMLPTMEKRMLDFVAFAQALPGFVQLPIRDQMDLLKGSYFERWIFLFGSWCVNTDTHIVTDPFNNGLVFDEDELMKFNEHCDEKMSEVWRIVLRYQQLDLTQQESIVAAALCLMNADANLSHVARVIISASVDYLLETLDYLIKKNHDPEERTLCRIIVLMYDIRSVDNFTREISHNLIDDGLEYGYDIPKIAIEILH